MMSKPENAPPSPRFLVAWLRLLVLLPLFLLRDSSARPTWPSPVELENTIARIAHPVELIPNDVEVISPVSFFQPVIVSLPTKRGWRWTPDAKAVIATVTVDSARTSPAALPASPAVRPVTPPSHPALTPVRPARTLAATRIAPPHPPASPHSPASPDASQLAAQWSHSPQLRDRFLASLLRNPSPSHAPGTAASVSRSPTLADPDARAALNAQLSFNPLTVVSTQLRAFATDPVLTASFTGDPALRREYNFLGCQLPGRASELRFGLTDLTEKQFRLNPGNVRSEESREHTATVSARFKF